ncbi:MAG: hypothetical protein KKF50_05715 [Nanoarchaeota archaeon]|nr:hypothetical protein [Nanoarchaeota archaeon]
MGRLRDKVFIALGLGSVYLGVDGLVYACGNNLDLRGACGIVKTAFDGYIDILTNPHNGDILNSVRDNITSIPELWSSINYLTAVPNIVTGLGLVTLGGYHIYKSRKG